MRKSREIEIGKGRMAEGFNMYSAKDLIEEISCERILTDHRELGTRKICVRDALGEFIGSTRISVFQR